MPIEQLPQSSISSLQSSQTLTHPPSLIKELVENSIDAGATSISIEVLPNLLDSIQVRDNGHGISPDGRDRELVAKRHCTSKITCMKDLDTVKTLGFRGEALASAATLGELTITTRTDGEKTAVTMAFDAKGDIKEQKKASAAVGTTVVIKNFLKSMPVRREVALKSQGKMLQEIKGLLFNYVLSHPDIRMAFKVTGKSKPGATTPSPWTYAPSKSVGEAVRKIFGKDLAASVEWISTEGSTAVDDKVVIEMLYVRPDADTAVVCKKPICTSYIFVDGRPVSAARRGFFKELSSLYKSYLRSAAAGRGDEKSYSDPFLYLNLICGPCTYDPNVEPAKDDVIFRDAEMVLRPLTELFVGIYGELKEKSVKQMQGLRKEKAPEADFNLLLARRQEDARPSEVPPSPRTELPPLPPLVPIAPAQTRLPMQLPSLKNLELDNMDFDDLLSSPLPPIQAPEQSEVPEHMPPAAKVSSDFTLTPFSGEQNRRTPPPPQWGSNTSSGNILDELLDDEDIPHAPPLDISLLEEAEREMAACQGSASKNPWILAKMNAPINPSSGSARSSSPPRAPVVPTPRNRQPLSIANQSRTNISPPQITPRPTRKTPQGRPSIGYDDELSEDDEHAGWSAKRRKVVSKPTCSSSTPAASNGVLDNWLSSGAGPSSEPKSALGKKWAQQAHQGTPTRTRQAPRSAEASAPDGPLSSPLRSPLSTRTTPRARPAQFSQQSSPENPPFKSPVARPTRRILRRLSPDLGKAFVTARDMLDREPPPDEELFPQESPIRPAPNRRTRRQTPPPEMLDSPMEIAEPAKLSPHEIAENELAELQAIQPEAPPATKRKTSRKKSGMETKPPEDSVKGITLHMETQILQIARLAASLMPELDYGEGETIWNNAAVNRIGKWFASRGLSAEERAGFELKDVV